MEFTIRPMKQARGAAIGKPGAGVAGPAGAAAAWVLILSFLFASPVFAQCPSEQKVAEGFLKMFKRDIKVLKVQSAAVPFLCEAQVSMGGRNDVLYTDSEGKYFIRGPLFDVEKEVNMSEQVIAQLNRLGAEEMKRLESLVAFTQGTGPKTVYFVTDPECSFCIRGLKVLKVLVDQGKLTVKFILYPLPMHERADEQSIAIICDNKSLEGLESKYESENQCPEGKEKISKAIAFMQERGISGTPTYVFEDGTYHVGIMQQEALLAK